jgi:hypothetical protein
MHSGGELYGWPFEGALCASDLDHHCAYEVGGSAQEAARHHEAEGVEHAQDREVVYHLHV